MSKGYLWRLPRADASTLKRLIADLLPETCWSFGGALLWDVRRDLADKRFNLRPINPVASSAIDISGDFGHAFADTIEVRWKRRDDGDYDVLVLTEQAGNPAQQQGLTQIATFPQVEAMAGRKALFLDTPAEIRAKKQHYRLDYNEYRAANGATQFVRYVRYESREEDEP
ncbi:MAG: hypothetical protein HGA45_42725 [Chloroflexales bacterium]|nr:hypothetical protein [Chloroflexales bacterium]